MVEYIGKYNVDYAGLSYDRNTPYELVIISEFDKDKEIRRKTYYFQHDKSYIKPKLKTEADIEKVMKFKQYSKIAVKGENQYILCD